MNRYYLTKAVKSLQRALRAEQERSARNRQQYEERVKNLKKAREDDYRLYCQMQNLYEKEYKHNRELVTDLTKMHSSLILWRGVAFTLIALVSILMLSKYITQ